MTSKLYIVIVNYNGFSDTVECLGSLLNSTDQNFQIFIIDNSEEVNEYNSLIKWANTEIPNQITTNFPDLVFPETHKPLDNIALSEHELLEQKWNNQFVFVKAKKNNGFAAANNIGLRYLLQYHEKNSFVWLLNNDTVIDINCIKNLKNQYHQHSQEGIITLFGTPLIEYFKPETIQAIGGRYHKLTGTTSHIGKDLPIDLFSAFDNSKIDYPIGASMITSFNFIEKVGLLNEEYFLFYEELDWMERALKLGGTVTVLPNLGVYHKHGKSTLTTRNKKKSEFIDLLSLKNRILFSRTYHKNYIWTVKGFILTMTLMKRLLSGDLKRIPKIIKLIFTF